MKKKILMASETIPSLLKARAQQSPETVAHWTIDGFGTWQPTTWREFHHTVSILAAGLQNIGLSPGQKIGLMAPTSQTWEYLQMAILMAGGIIIGIDPHDLDENINEIANRTELAGLIIQNPSLLKKISSNVRSNLNFIIGIDCSSKDNDFENFFKLSDLQKTKNEYCFSNRLNSNDPATIIFTSGTTGTPKGIMYTHAQIFLACKSILETFDDVEEGNKLVCWLPLSNLFQRMINFCAIAIGASTYFVENPQDVLKYIPSINPHFFAGVPRFFQKLYSGIREEIDQKSVWIQKLIEWALKVGDTHACSLRSKKTPPLSTRIFYKVLDPLILKRIRQLMGSNLKYIVSGSAPMPQWLLERFHAMGILILEAYGISENIIPIAANQVNAVKFGTVGKPLSGNNIRLLNDGELVVKGPGVFSGYYNDESQEGSLKSDGYLATGDYAKIDNEGFITLTGRKTEIFKISTGRRIAPAAIEERIRRVAYIDHAVVFGAGKNFLIALLSISLPLFLKQAKKLNPTFTINKANIPTAFYNSIKFDVIQEIAQLPKYKHPAGFLLTTHPFTINGGELTANLKLRRKNIEIKFKKQISQLYAKLKETHESGNRVFDNANNIIIYEI
ncbi:MAG: AMP-binding protein [Desulfobacterales bacterium]|nr:AMP-binding protein [Desulfobacterales bacterium]